MPEQLELKREIFAELDKICPPQTVLATGTTALSVTRIAAATGRPERILGLLAQRDVADGRAGHPG